MLEFGARRVRLRSIERVSKCVARCMRLWFSKGATFATASLTAAALAAALAATALAATAFTTDFTAF